MNNIDKEYFFEKIYRIENFLNQMKMHLAVQNVGYEPSKTMFTKTGQPPNPNIEFNPLLLKNKDKTG